MFQKGSRFGGSGPDKDRWVVSRKLGEGQFAEVYEVKDYHARGDSQKAGLCGAQTRFSMPWGARQHPCFIAVLPRTSTN